MFDELQQFVDAVTEFHREMVITLYQRFDLPEYTNAAAANNAFNQSQGHFAYNVTDDEPMFYDGSNWKKVSDGTNAS
jgi:hypothetical protein